MEKDREDRIRKLMKESGVEKASNNFQDSVMSEIRKQEFAKEKAMYTLLQKNASEEVSSEFTNQLMAKLPSQGDVKESRIIGFYGWLGIGLGFAAMVVLVMISDYSSETTTPDIVSKSVGEGISKIINQISVGPIMLMCVLAVFALAFLDYFSSRAGFLRKE